MILAFADEALLLDQMPLDVHVDVAHDVGDEIVYLHIQQFVGGVP
jgi:hypothetical protein